MAIDIQRTNQENLDFLAKPLEPEKCKALELVCNELGFDRKTFERIEFQVRLLRDFELHGKVKIKSTRGQIKAIEKLATAAKVLGASIRELNNIQCIDIDDRLPKESTPHLAKAISNLIGTTGLFYHTPGVKWPSVETVPDCHIYYLNNGNAGGRVLHIGREAERLSKCCIEICIDENTAGVKGGRRNTLDHYSYYLGTIWDIIQGSNITLGRGGTFERLCEEVFIAAGVQTSPEGAIRRLVDNDKAKANISDEPF